MKLPIYKVVKVGVRCKCVVYAELDESLNTVGLSMVSISSNEDRNKDLKYTPHKLIVVQNVEGLDTAITKMKYNNMSDSNKSENHSQN